MLSSNVAFHKVSIWGIYIFLWINRSVLSSKRLINRLFPLTKVSVYGKTGLTKADQTLLQVAGVAVRVGALQPPTPPDLDAVTQEVSPASKHLILVLLQN